MIQDDRDNRVTTVNKTHSQLNEDHQETHKHTALSASSVPPKLPGKEAAVDGGSSLTPCASPPPVIEQHVSRLNTDTELPSETPGESNMAWLYCVKGNPKGNLISLDREMIKIGTGDECELILDDPELNRYHAILIQREQQWLLCDLGATIGLRINNRVLGAEVTAPYLLKDGDRLAIGETEFVFKKV